jgi:serine/threonine protein phosphatase PrpC
VVFARKRLIESIINHKGLYYDNVEDIVWDIRSGFRQTHLAMWTELHSWPISVYGVHLSGTTASVVIFKNGKIYRGRIGDSSVVLYYQREGKLLSKGHLTKDHKPERGVAMRGEGGGARRDSARHGRARLGMEKTRLLLLRHYCVYRNAA